MTPIEKLQAMQAEQRPWVAHNFGDRPSWMPLLGIVEELGEREQCDHDYGGSERHDEVVDALADVMVFSMDYCSAMGWDIGTLWDAALTYGVCEVNLLTNLGKIAHAHLKKAQGIRVNENHDAEGRMGMIHLFVNLRKLAEDESIDLVEETYRVWQIVKQRDWKKDPAHAGEPR